MKTGSNEGSGVGGDGAPSRGGPSVEEACPADGRAKTCKTRGHNEGGAEGVRGLGLFHKNRNVPRVRRRGVTYRQMSYLAS